MSDCDSDAELWDYVFSESLPKKIESSESEPFKENCKHEYEYVNGIKTCEICGTCFFLEAEGVFPYYHNFYAVPPKAIYKQVKYLQPLLKRMNGQITSNEITPLIINTLKMLPNGNMKTIHRFIKHKKLNIMDDFYYWRLKNNIETVILDSDIWQLLQLLKNESREIRKNVSIKDFLTEYFTDNLEKYGCFLPLVQRKNKKDNIATKRKKAFNPSYFAFYMKLQK